MAEETVTEDEITRMLEEIYKDADKEMDEREKRAMKSIEGNSVAERIELSPSFDSTSGSDSRSERSNPYSRDSTVVYSQSPSKSPGDSRSNYSQSVSPSPGDSRSYSGSRSYSRSGRSPGYDHSLEQSSSPSPGNSRRFNSSERSGSPSPEIYYSEELLPEPDHPDDNSELSSDSSQPRCTAAAWLTVVCLIIGAGLGIGFGVAAANEVGKPAPSPTGSDKEDQGVGGAIKLLDAKDYFLFGGEEMAATTEAKDVSACLAFCKEYDAMKYIYVQDTCSCYNSVTCLMPWGPKVDTTNYQFVGDLYVNNELEECSEDYCQALNDQNGLCFTANSQDYREYSLYGASILKREAQTMETLEECLDLCASYDAASFLNFKDCACYDQAECWLEWGDSIDAELLLGTVYSKNPLDVCEETYCEIKQDVRCFKANVEDSKEYTVSGTALVELNSTSVSSEEECLELCAPYDAASFRRPDVCTCFENPTCWLPWGGNVDTSLFFGKVYSKTPLDFCESDYCEANTEDSLCFTGNEEDCRFYALYGPSMFQTASAQTPGNLQACLDLCAPYDAAAFGNFADCSCHNFVTCKLRWGDEVDSENIIGTIYTKQGLEECEKDYCDTVGKDGLCFTGNAQSYSSYSLFGNSLNETADSNDVNDKEECLDFCKQYDSAQFLNFQDPKCKCYDGAECWLAWPPETDTSAGEYTGDVYSKTELQFCSFDYCSQLAEGELCAVGNGNGNRQ